MAVHAYCKVSNIEKRGAGRVLIETKISWSSFFLPSLQFVGAQRPSDWVEALGIERSEPRERSRVQQHWAPKSSFYSNPYSTSTRCLKGLNFRRIRSAEVARQRAKRIRNHEEANKQQDGHLHLRTIQEKCKSLFANKQIRLDIFMNLQEDDLKHKVHTDSKKEEVSSKFWTDAQTQSSRKHHWGRNNTARQLYFFEKASPTLRRKETEEENPSRIHMLQGEKPLQIRC